MFHRVFHRLRLMFGIRSKSLFVVLYLAGVALIFYIGLYSASIVIVDNTFCGCTNTCINKTPITENKDNLLQFKVSNRLNPEVKRTKVFLLIIILTGPSNIERRNAMRFTWLNATRLTSVSKRFVIGIYDLDNKTKMSLQREQKMHGDMLFLQDLKDAYNKLTRKLLSALLWINENVESSFVMKVDDDTFANLLVIEQELKTKYYGIDNLYWGFHRGSASVKKSGPWAEPKWILCDRYLPYALGGGYILSMKLVEYIANISSFLVLYNSEDVSLGTWLSPIQLTRVHDPRFDTESMSRGCKNAHIVSHKQSIKDMYDKFNMLKNHGKLCMKEEFIRMSFIYSWNVPPSQCCERRKGIP
ncbi:beta-1,3-galactosyltransferase 6-like [Dendronephthya gigantea]|uniref:beta-1,3-galactosyltransferase 6-like n=1 Tax=Dendronephthya gigantea TaxID=151771 RepID=UPI001069BC84|nr:beta-1,3-galactosyltransferase 6-like [Dendronephthya gigantea]